MEPDTIGPAGSCIAVERNTAAEAEQKSVAAGRKSVVAGQTSVEVEHRFVAAEESFAEAGRNTAVVAECIGSSVARKPVVEQVEPVRNSVGRLERLSHYLELES